MSAITASALQNQDKFVVKTLRISVIGEQGCGKSTFVEQFVTGKGRLSKSSITFELERTLISRIIKRECAASSLPGAPKVPEIVTKYDLHVHDACASPVTNFMALETASCADFVIICFSMYGDNISVLFQIILDLFKVCHAASRARPPLMLVALRKSWEKPPISKQSSQKDSKATSGKQSENFIAIVRGIIDMFQCKLNFVVLCDDSESDGSGKPNAAIQTSANVAVGQATQEFLTASEVFSRAVDEYELSKDHVRASVCDSSAYRIYYNPQHHRLACILKKDWTKDANIDTFIFPDFVAISVLSCNLLDMPPKIFDVTQLQCLDVSDNPLTKLNDGFSTLSMLTVLNASNTKLSVEPSVLVACTTLTDLNLSRNCLLNASCLLKCASLIRLDISDNAGCVIIDAAVADAKIASLSYLNLSKTTCASLDFIGLLTGITYLNLRETGIREASLSFLTQLKNLRHVDISCNKLSDIAIPAHLEIVLVDNNQLKSFEISCLTSAPHHLTKLSIKNNQLTELPKQLWHVSSLQELSFAGNSVSMLDFSFAFCGKRLVKFECDGNPFNLMPPAISDLLGNNKFSEACDLSIKSLPINKIAVLSKSNGPAFESITKHLSRVSMIVNIQEKISSSSKTQWAKTLLVANMNPARLYFLNPDDNSDTGALEARMKDKPFWDTSNPTFKFIHESGGARQCLGTISLGNKSGPGAATGKFDSTLSSKTIDFFSASNRHQWDQYFKAAAKLQPKSDRQNIFFKSMPGFFSRASVSANSQFLGDIDPASPNISPLFYAAAPRFDSIGLMSEPEFSQTNSQGADSSHLISTQASLAAAAAAAAVPTPNVPEIANAEKISSALEQQVSCKYNSIFLSAPVNDMNYFLPFLANSDIVVVNMAGDAFTQSELSAVLSGIKFISRQCLKHVFVVMEPGQATSYMEAQGQRGEDAFKVICYHPSGSEDLLDQIHEAMKSLSAQRAIEPFVEYFQSFIMGVIKNRPPWTDSKTMMISFSELLDCIFTRRNSFDSLGKCCLSFLEDASYDIHKYMLQTCQFLDDCGVLLCWNSHTRDPVIVCNLDLFVQDAMIPLLHASRNRKQVLTDGRQQSSSSSRVVLTSQDRAQIWSTLPAVTSSVMGDLDWALLSLHVVAVAPEEMPADGALLMPQSSPESMQDRSSSTASIATNKKEGWIYCEDSLSRAVKRHWFTCSSGPDGVYSLTWRNSESTYTTSTSQSISFGKSTKTTVSQTKRNRQGWSHCCRVDHEDSRVSAKKLHSTKIVMCFNNEKEMREWWSFIESSFVPRASSVISAPESAIKSNSIDFQTLNLTLALEDEHVSKNMITLSSIFEGIDFGNASASGTITSGEQTADSAQSASTWLVFVVRIDAVSEYILRSVTCSMALYMPDVACGRCDHAIKAIFKRGAAVSPSDPVAVRRDCSTAVLSLMEHSTFTEATVISAGHECHVLADILLEALIRSTTCGVAQCTVFPAEDVARTAETYALPELCCRTYVPAVFPSYSFLSTTSRTVLPNLRRIVHIHSGSLTDDSRIIQEWASSNHWEYATYTCNRTDCIRAAEKASACERLVLILESSFVVHRGRSRLRLNNVDSSATVANLLLSLTEGVLLSEIFEGARLAKESICVVPWQLPSDVAGCHSTVVVPDPVRALAKALIGKEGLDHDGTTGISTMGTGERNDFSPSLRLFMTQ